MRKIQTFDIWVILAIGSIIFTAIAGWIRLSQDSYPAWIYNAPIGGLSVALVCMGMWMLARKRFKNDISRYPENL